MTDYGRITEALKETNKWWHHELSLEFKPREIYPKLTKFLATRQIIALVGLRRVGKTTLMLQVVKDKLKSGFKPSNIAYFSFDDFRDVRIKEVIEAYANIFNNDLSAGQYLFLFDELQKVENWEEQIKRVYDNNPNFKMVVSGSESLFIRKKSRESLAGRFFEFTVKPLSFKEFLTFRDLKVENIILQREEVVRAFNDYVLCNGFPEIVSADTEIIEKYIKETIIEKILYKDIPQIMPVRDIAILQGVFNAVLNGPGDVIRMESLASDLGISRQTVSNYLDYLEKSFLIRKLYNFSKSARKTERKLKKYYPTVLPPTVIERKNPGKVLEALMVLQLNAEFFWRDAYKNEVDIILSNKEMLPVEVKHGGKLDGRGLPLFMKRFGLRKGIVISLDTTSTIKWKDKTIQVVPAYKFLLE